MQHKAKFKNFLSEWNASSKAINQNKKGTNINRFRTEIISIWV